MMHLFKTEDEHSCSSYNYYKYLEIIEMKGPGTDGWIKGEERDSVPG
jgi:hypothetical protein